MDPVVQDLWEHSALDALDLPTNMTQGHSISCIYQAVLARGVFWKPVQISKVQFPQAEGCHPTDLGQGLPEK